MAVAEVGPYRWSPEEFLRAWEAGVFERRVELIDGEVYPVVSGPWHGDTTGQVVRALPNHTVKVTMATLPAGSSLPDPDCWVCRRDAVPVASIGPSLVGWDPADVLLVVEVSDETVAQDLGIKAQVYAAAGYGVYWVITREGVYEHTGPGPGGYAERVLHPPGDRVEVGYAGTALAVDDLLAPS